MFEEVALGRQCEEEWSSGDHDSDVGEELAPYSTDGIEEGESRDGGSEDGVSCGGDHEVVGDASGAGVFEDGVVLDRVGFDLVQRKCFITQCIHVEVNAAVVVEHEVADRVCPLDGHGVGVPCIEEPGILDRDEVASQLIGPELGKLAGMLTMEQLHRQDLTYLVLEVRVGILAALLRLDPHVGDFVGGRRLMQDARDLRLPRLRGIIVMLQEMDCGSKHFLVFAKEEEERL